MFFILSKILSFALKPTFWILIFLLTSIINYKRRKFYLIISTFTFLFFGNDFIYKKLIKIWEEPQIDISKIQKEYELGILLGGFSEYDYKTNRHNFKKEADRLIYTVHLYNKKIIKKILISGGNGNLLNNTYKESETVKRFLIQHGIDELDIIIESKSRNTKENAIETAKIVNLKKEHLLITSATHMKRAVYCFDKVKIKTKPFPVDNTMSYSSRNIEHILLPRAKTFELWEEFLHEIIGLFVYKLSW
jgi:uncharacterized SAM-binding protein YcdF (DUF218 family)